MPRSPVPRLASCWAALALVAIAMGSSGCGSATAPPSGGTASKSADSGKPAAQQAPPAQSEPVTQPEPKLAAKEPPSRLTKPNLDRVQIGMTEKQVNEILGPAGSVEKSPNDDGVVYHNWNVDEIYVNVYFQNGKVIQKGGSGLLPSVLPKLTKANFDKIEVGMKEADLYALLGHPTGTTVVSDELKVEWEDITHIEKKIEIDIVDGKVTSKSSKGLE